MCILKLTLKLSPWTKCDIDWRGCYNIRWKYKIWPLVNWDIWHPEQIEKIEPASNWECNKAALLFPGCLSRPLHHHLSRAASMLGTHILVGGSRVPSFSGMISWPLPFLFCTSELPQASRLGFGYPKMRCCPCHQPGLVIDAAMWPQIYNWLDFH